MRAENAVRLIAALRAPGATRKARRRDAIVVARPPVQYPSRDAQPYARRYRAWLFPARARPLRRTSPLRSRLWGALAGTSSGRPRKRQLAGGSAQLVANRGVSKKTLPVAMRCARPQAASRDRALTGGSAVPHQPGNRSLDRILERGQRFGVVWRSINPAGNRTQTGGEAAQPSREGVIVAPRLCGATAAS